MPVHSKRVATAEASSKTVQRRLQQLRGTRSALRIELEDEMRALPKERRQQLLQEVGLPLEIPAENGLAMKATPFHGTRILRRYIQIFIQIHVCMYMNVH